MNVRYRNFSKFKIVSVVDLSNPTETSKKYSYRIGRICYIDEDKLTEFLPLKAYYDDDETYLRTSPISRILYKDNILEIETLNRCYKFERVTDQ